MAQQREERPLLLDPTRSDDLPVGTNLSWRLQVLIHSGRIAPRERLPGVREFAAGAGVNVNTARSVYRRLENDGLAVSQQGLGTFVAPHVAVAPTLEQFAAQAAAEAIAQGIDPRELARALYTGSSPRGPFSEQLDEELREGLAPRTSEEERSARAALRGQIARLEAKLAPYVEASDHAEQATPPTAHPRLVSIDELEAIRDELVSRLKRAQSEAARREERQGAARRWREEALENPAAHRWEYATREDLGEPGCGRVEVRPAWGPVGALMDWWRVKMSSGCP
jgi:DNA-binding transcriptional regulator YhcF (GntR family)